MLTPLFLDFAKVPCFLRISVPSDQGTFTPVGAQGGGGTFPPEFCNKICTIFVRAIKSHNFAKNKERKKERN